MVLMKALPAKREIEAPRTSRAGLVSVAISILSLGLVWFEVVHHLQSEWSFNPQYSYGWSVPFLAMFLLWRRFLTRPRPAPRPPPKFWPTAVIVGGAVLLFPVRFLSAANPDWRLLSWAGAFFALAISLSSLFLAGGRPWLRHFAFPMFFMLVAVPWPVQFEQSFTQTLMRAVTGTNVFGLNVAGVPALQHGNVIEVGSGLIGIEEACSGVRSLQATFMVSLFLGELYQFSTLRRLSLVLAGGILAFFCNLVRTAFLVWVGTQHGASAIHAWHDPAGLTILLCCLIGLWLTSLCLGRGYTGSMTVAEGKENEFGWRLPLGSGAMLPVWIIIIEVSTLIWYGVHLSAIQSSPWTVNWPTAQEEYREVAISPEAEGILRYNEGGGGSWKAKDGHPWVMYYFRWGPGRTAALFVKNHRPDVCLPASGMTLVRDDGIHLLEVKGIKLPVRSYRFDYRGSALNVFYCYWDAKSSYETTAAANTEDWTFKGRIGAALKGRKEMGAQMLELVVWGYEYDNEAKAALEEQLVKILSRG